MKKILLTLTLLLLPAAAFADISVASFNVKHWGWNNGKNPDALADIFSRFDLIAVQEVMDDDVVEDMARRLSQASGDQWTSLSSHAIGRGSYQEHYSFLWNDNKVKYLDGAVVYLDDRDVYAREPLSARFETVENGIVFALASVHILYGDSRADRLPEIRALASYWNWLDEIYPDTPQLLVGDFNLDQADSGWDTLRTTGARPAIQGQATTLSPHDGRYVSPYDNIWYTPGELPLEKAGVFRFPQALGLTHKQARDTVSDHVPVFVSFAGGDANLSASAQRPSTTVSRQRQQCIDINTASAAQLDSLPHIGPARAQYIIDHRPWESASALTQIHGVGSSRVADIIDSGKLCL